jgi:hypothetical protein
MRYASIISHATANVLLLEGGSKNKHVAVVEIGDVFFETVWY